MDTKSPAEDVRVAAAIERLTLLRPAYTYAVRQLLARGERTTLDALLAPVEQAEVRASACLSEWRDGTGSEAAVVEAHEVVAACMLAVIRAAA